MSLDQFNSVAHTWLPILTVAGIVWRVYRNIHKSITAWAGTLLDNHLRHVQESLDRQEAKAELLLALQQQQVELLTTIAEK